MFPKSQFEAAGVWRYAHHKQNGFDADLVMKEDNRLLKNPPILYQEGEMHHQMRRETNKYFTPAITQQKHREMMENLAIDGLRIERRPDVSFNPVVQGHEVRNFILAMD